MKTNKQFRWSTVLLQIAVVAISACMGPVAQELMTPTPEATTVEAAPAQEQAAAPAEQEAGQSRLDVVKARGSLVCGVNSAVRGFGFQEADGSYSGFDVDFCKAIAAALFGDANAVEYRPLSSSERFTAVATGEVDVLWRNSTWTLTRDSREVGMEWVGVNFYDGQGMMVRADSGISSLEEMDGATVCVQTGTTTELNLADTFNDLGLAFEAVVFEDAPKTREAYDQGRCDGYTTDKSGLATERLSMTNPDEHIILDVTMSKEPLAGAVAQGDPVWADAVRWIFYGLVNAEEYGVTSANTNDMMSSENANVRRLLGVEGEMGAKLGLDNDFMVKALTAVGNYGEIYDRNLGPDTPYQLERGLNALWTEGGLQYAPPFR
jgi:general L-amino acid transport system substrate-binding protein